MFLHTPTCSRPILNSTMQIPTLKIRARQKILYGGFFCIVKTRTQCFNLVLTYATETDLPGHVYLRYHNNALQNLGVVSNTPRVMCLSDGILFHIPSLIHNETFKDKFEALYRQLQLSLQKICLVCCKCVWFIRSYFRGILEFLFSLTFLFHFTLYRNFIFCFVTLKHTITIYNYNHTCIHVRKKN